jgi:thiol:disulfide interchange protein
MNRKEYLNLLEKNESTIVVFITATWCAPCKSIKQYVDQKLEGIPCIRIDVVKDADVYASLRSKKQVKGVPTLLAYTKGSIIPSASISGASQRDIDDFFVNLDFLV